MSRVTNTAVKLGGHAVAAPYCGSSCNNSRLVCLNTPDGKNFIYEVDSCGNALTELKPLGTCSVDANGVPFPFDAAGNQIIEINELDMDINSVVQNGSALVFTAEDGTTVTVDICAIVAANCNSPMVVNADGSVTYTDNAGTVTTIPAPIVTTFTLNADGSATYISEDGTVTTLPAPTVSALAVNGSIVTHTNGNGVAVPFDICAIVAANCNSPMTINADGSVTYVDNAGAVTVIPAPVASTMTDNGAGVFTHNNGAGDVVVIDVCATVAANCSDSLVVNADGSVTHTAVDGTVQVIPAPVVSALAVAGSAVTHTAGDGTVVTFDICAIVAANCNSPMTLNPDGSVDYVDNAGVATTIPAPVNSSLVADVAAGTFTHTSGDGVDTVVDVCALAQICAPTLVPGPGVNQYTFDNGYGVTQIIDVNEIDMDINSMTVAGSVVNFSSEDGTTGSFDICAIVAANCNSNIVVNADGSVSHTDNAGDVVVIPAPPQTAFTDKSGNEITSGALLQSTDFVAGVQEDGDGQMVIGSDGSCKLVEHTCENNPDHSNSVIINGQSIGAEIGHNARLSFSFDEAGDTMFDDTSAPGDTFEFSRVFEFEIDNCDGGGCISYTGTQQHILRPGSATSEVGIVVWSEYLVCDDAGTPLTGQWLSHGTGGNTTGYTKCRPWEAINNPIGGRLCLPNGAYQLKFRQRLAAVNGYTDPGWSLQAQNNAIDVTNGVSLRCCP